MLNIFLVLLRYEITTLLRNAEACLTPLLFFVIVTCLFPLALGNDNELLKTIAPGIIWVTALLAMLMSVDSIFRRDAEEGYLDCILLSPQPTTLFVLAKVTSHWLIYGLPLVLISPLLSLMLHINAHVEWVLFITLLLGTPVLSLLGAIGAALLVGVRSHSLMLPILIMPLYIPVLIFGTGTAIAANMNLAINGYVAILGALILISLAFAPILTALALRTGVNQ